MDARDVSSAPLAEAVVGLRPLATCHVFSSPEGMDNRWAGFRPPPTSKSAAARWAAVLWKPTSGVPGAEPGVSWA